MNHISSTSSGSKDEYIETVTTIVTQVVGDVMSLDRNKCDIEKIVTKVVAEITVEEEKVKCKLNLEDDFDLRKRHPKINAMSYDAEVVFLITNAKDVKAKFGYETTSCAIIPRKFTKNYRTLFLRNYENRQFEKVPLTMFMVLGRKYYFDLDGNEINLEQWVHSMEDYSRGGSEEADYKHMFVFIPKEWKEEACSIQTYLLRRKAVNEGCTGAHTGTGGMKYVTNIKPEYNRY